MFMTRCLLAAAFVWLVRQAGKVCRSISCRRMTVASLISTSRNWASCPRRARPGPKLPSSAWATACSLFTLAVLTRCATVTTSPATRPMHGPALSIARDRLYHIAWFWPRVMP